jgi:integrase
MASYRKRKNLWQAQVRIKDQGSISKSFHSRKEAYIWATEQEALMLSGKWKKKDNSTLRLSDLMKKYLQEVTPKKKGRGPEERRLRRLLREIDLMNTYLKEVDPPVIASYRDRRLKDGVRACQYDLVLIRHAWNIAKLEWGWDVGSNPVEQIKLPKNNPPRERRLRVGEYDLLKIKAMKTRVWYLWPIIEMAIETGMRRGEILSLEWINIDFERARVLLPMTKNGRSRWVPLSKKALLILDQVPRTSNLVFPVSEVAVRQSWERLRKRSGLMDLNFHDLRHEAISRMFEKGLNVPEVASISGHRTASQLFRYVQVEGISL